MPDTTESSGGKVTIVTAPGTKLTPEARQKLEALTAELQKGGTALDVQSGHCKGYTHCDDFSKPIVMEE